MKRPRCQLNQSILLFLSFLIKISLSVRCHDCVGIDCLGSFCYGDYCMVSQYAPRWGSIRWGEPEIVKGCVNGSMLSKDIRSHCEFAEDADEPFTCFCDGKDLCNSPKNLRKVEREEVEMVQCVCNGAHCKKDKTCLGELCTYVKNHKTKKVEQGCMNASVPLIERRSIGSCMVPPITGAFHHTVGKDAQSLLGVESCVCGTDYCNSEKPEVTVAEKEKGKAYVEVTTMGTTTKSRETDCTGEYVFMAYIKSKIGMLQSFNTTGCISFFGDDPLPEEMDPVGCASFYSESLEVKTCFKTSDKRAIGRARASKQVPETKPSRSNKQKASRKQVEVEYDDSENDEEEAEEEEPKKQSKAAKTSKSAKDRKKVKEEEKEEEEEEEEEKEEEKEKEEKILEKEEKQAAVPTQKSFIFEKPTQPPIPDDSNTTMITVFVLLILCIIGSGIVIKFELHKKLKRSSYDTVAGG